MSRTAQQRFDEKWRLDEASGCWLWTAFIHPLGYGKFSLGGKFVQANRASYVIHVGAIPDGMHVCHRCDNPVCVNPAHLFIGSREDNMRDRDAKMRQPYGVKNGNARLTDRIALQIFSDPRPRIDISKAFGVSRATVQMIKNKRRWAHIHIAGQLARN